MSKKRLSSQIRLTLLRGMEALGTTASNMASSAKLKVNEINLENRRREILTDFSLQAFELWQKGVEMPEPLSSMLVELSDVENRLSLLRAQKYAKVPTADAPAEAAPEAPATPPDNACTCEILPDTDDAAFAAQADAPAETESAENSGNAGAESEHSASDQETASCDTVSNTPAEPSERNDS